MITPTVGRIVLYHPRGEKVATVNDQPVPAIVTAVWSERCVNLAVFDANGSHVGPGRTSVRLVQPDDDVPEGPYCEWMPYQVKKDHGSESGEKGAGTEQI